MRINADGRITAVSMSSLKHATKLVEDLDKTFRDSPIKPDEPIESIMYRAGQRKVIEKAYRLLEEYKELR